MAERSILTRWPDVAVALVASLFGGLLGGLIVAHKADGSAAEWTQAIGTLLAFGVGLVLFRQQKGVLFAQGESLRAEATDRRRRLASKMNAWTIAINPEEEEPWVPDRDSPYDVVVVQYENGGDQPIYELVVYVLNHFGPDAEKARAHVGLVPPRHMAETRVRLLKPSEPLLSWPPVDIVFIDATGISWRRTWQGRLEELPAHPDPGVC